MRLMKESFLSILKKVAGRYKNLIDVLKTKLIEMNDKNDIVVLKTMRCEC